MDAKSFVLMKGAFGPADGIAIRVHLQEIIALVVRTLLLRVREAAEATEISEFLRQHIFESYSPQPGLSF